MLQQVCNPLGILHVRLPALHVPDIDDDDSQLRGLEEIGQASVRTAHNVHKVDVYACNLHFFSMIKMI